MDHALRRREFLTRLGWGAAAVGLAPGGLGARQFPALGIPPFAVSPADSDERVFAAARREFLFPTDVTYCNTGTLGASPREVVAALVKGTERIESTLPDWPYFQSDREPLTGYQPL